MPPERLLKLAHMLGTRLANRYEIVSEIGRGGMGVVYRARDPLLNRDVAIKLIPPTLLTQESQERFQREAQIVAQMDHPSIAPIFDFGEHEGSMFFVMPLLPGVPLRARLRDRNLRLGDAVDIGIQVSDALECSHLRGIIHRDIKPENIMVADEPSRLRIRVMDFGLAKSSTDEGLTQIGMMMGTLSYLSPEQVVAGVIDFRSDVYALGVVLYECAVGQPPFTGTMQSVLYRIVHEQPQSPRSLGAPISEELEEIILQCLAKDPLKRIASAGDLRVALTRYRSHLNEDDRERRITAPHHTITVDRTSKSMFVGRDNEVAGLQRRLNAAIAGECQLVMVGGEAGVGKTRLLEELEALAKARDILVLHGRFMEKDLAFAYHGFCDVIQDFFRVLEKPGCTLETPDLSDLAPDLVSIFPVLFEVSELRLAALGDPKIALSNEQRNIEEKLYVQELLARTLIRLAGGKPLVLFFENLHGADVSLEALPYIFRRLGPMSILIVGTYRLNEVDRKHPLTNLLSALGDDDRFQNILLGPLSPTDHRTFLEILLGSSTLDDRLVKKIFETTEANPLYTLELLRSLRNSGVILRDDDGSWRLVRALEVSSDAVPATIQQAVQKRLTRMDDGDREILSTAAILGRGFEYRDLVSLVDRQGSEEGIDNLVREGFLIEPAASRGDRLSFASGIMRDVLYAEVPRRRRRILHQKYGEQLERRFAGRLERIYPDLLHHFLEGGVPAKAAEFGVRLAEQALAGDQAREAERICRSLLDLIHENPADVDKTTEGDTRVLLAAALRANKKLPEALEEVESAIRIFQKAQDPKRTVGAMQLACEVAWESRSTAVAYRWIEQAVATARAARLTELLVKVASFAATITASTSGSINELDSGSERSLDSLRSTTGGTLHVAVSDLLTTIDPSLVTSPEHAEVISNVFETITRDLGTGGVLPWLASEVHALDGCRRFRFHLRDRVLFHDGRPLTARDVSYSYERLLRNPGSGQSRLLFPILGAEAVSTGASTQLAGFKITSDSEFEIELTAPMGFFPALLSHPATSIVPALTADPFTSVIRDQLTGTGPFRINRFESGSRLVLSRNGTYWQAALPKVDRLIFHIAVPPKEIAEGFRQGSLSVAASLPPAETEELRNDPLFSAGYRAALRLSTTFVAFNPKRPLFADREVRRSFVEALDVERLVLGSAGRFARPAGSFFPPGLLDVVPPDLVGHPGSVPMPPVLWGWLTTHQEVTALIESLLVDRYAGFGRELTRTLREKGAQIRMLNDPFQRATLRDFGAAHRNSAEADVIIGHWQATYPDPDDFAYGVLHTRGGLLGNILGSSELDRLIEAGRTEIDPLVRQPIYRQIEQFIRRESLLLPLFHEQSGRFVRPEVEGLQVSYAQPEVSYAGVWMRA